MIKKGFFILVFGAMAIGLSAFLGNASGIEGNRFTDLRDGQVYDLVEIGELLWFRENLKFASPGSVCYDSLKAHCDKYGRLYSYEEAKKVCPENWRLPNHHDVEMIHKIMGTEKINGIAAQGEWHVKKSKKFDNELGFTALPAGRIDTFTFYSEDSKRWVDTIAFHQMGIAASYWIDDRETEDGLLHWHIGTPIGERKSGLHRHEIYPEIHKFSVRCVCEKK